MQRDARARCQDETRIVNEGADNAAALCDALAMTLVRAVTTDDFEAVAAIVNHYILSTAIHFAYEAIAAAELRASWEQHRDRYPVLVVEDGGAVAGFAKAGPFRDRDAYAWTPECGVYLRPNALGRGLGAALYQRLLAILEAQGFHSAMAGIALPNDASVRLHERLGFVKVGHVARAGYKHGRWHDLGLWQKDLAPADRAAGEILPPAYG